MLVPGGFPKARGNKIGRGMKKRIVKIEGKKKKKERGREGKIEN